jgi:hypothetical protein
MPLGIDDEVEQHAADGLRVQHQGRHLAGLEAHLGLGIEVVAIARALREHITHERVQIGLHERLLMPAGAVGGAGEVQELGQQFIQIGDVAVQAVQQLGVALTVQHLGGQAHLGQRCAQVVREAGEHQHALVFVAGQADGHLVEAVGERGDLGGAVFGQRGGALASAQGLRGLYQGLQRLVDAALDHPGAQQRQQRAGGAGQQPRARVWSRGHCAGHRQPVAIAIDVDAQGHGTARVTLPTQLAALQGQLLCDQVDEITLQRLEAVA